MTQLDEYGDESIPGWSPQLCPFFKAHREPFYCDYCGECGHAETLTCPNDDGQHLGQWDWRMDRRRLLAGLLEHADCRKNCVRCFPAQNSAALYVSHDLDADGGTHL